VVQHSTSYWGAAVIQAQSLANNGTSGAGAVITSTAYTDYWTVSFINGAGVLFVGSASCGFESDDNGDNVNIQLNSSNFSVMMPVSSSCPNNDYNTNS
jgi:hypothetical protein